MSELLARLATLYAVWRAAGDVWCARRIAAGSRAAHRGGVARLTVKWTSAGFVMPRGWELSRRILAAEDSRHG